MNERLKDSLQQATRKEGVNRRSRWIDFETHLKKSAQIPEKADLNSYTAVNWFVTFAIFFINQTMGRAKNSKAKPRSLNKTTESLPNSQGPGQTCETKQKKPTDTPKTATPFSTAAIQDELDFGDVASFLCGEIAGESKGGYLSLI